MYKQTKRKRFLGDQYWRNQERLNELERLLDSEYRAYIDPAIVANMKKILQDRKERQPP